MTSCPSCGADNVGGAQFCTKCGVTLPASGQSAYAPPVSDYSPTGGASSYNQPQGSTAYAPPGAALYSPQPAPGGQPSQVGMKADPVMRIASFFIDILVLLVCMIPFILVAIIPFIGWIIAWLMIPVVLIAYHLLRDIMGASPGKMLLGMKVMGKDGREAPNSSRVLRNVLFAIPPVFFFLPIIGHVIGGLISFALLVTELIMLLSQGERIGDRIANTVVVKTK
jgi:uncharacterized RDD family membrane protein YckC